MQFQSSYRWVCLVLFGCGIAAAQTPTIQSVVNAPSMTAPLCPGGVTLIVGTNLGPSAVFKGQATGLTVTVNGESAPVYSSSATQIGFQIPFDIPVGPATVLVMYQGLTSAPFAVKIAAVAPGIFTTAQGEPIFVRADGSPGSSQNPANPGETISIFMGGLGPTNPPTAAGVIPSSPVVTVNLVTETVGNESAKVIFAALTNTFGIFGVYQVNFTVPRDLPSGSYPMVVSTKGADSVPVLLPISNLGLALTQVGFTFQAVQGGGTTAPNSFRIINGTPRAVTFTVTPSTVSGGSWLKVSTTAGAIDPLGSINGNTSPPITVTVNPGSMTPGDYYGSVRVDSPTVLNSPQSLSVILTILPPTGNPGPVVQPSGIVFVQAEGDTTPPQIVTITNLTNRSSDFSATSAVVGNLIWFNATPLVGTVLPNTPFQFSIALAPRVPAGVYRGSVTLNFPSDKATRVIDLELVVTPAVLSEPSFEGALSGRDAGAPCTPAKLLPVFTMLGTGFSTSVAWPTNLEVTVLDDCGTPMKNGGVSVSFSNGDLPISLLGTSDGKWSGTWTAINPRSSALTVTATATQVSTGLKGTVQVGGSAQANPDVPIVLGALSSGSYFKPPAPSPGELVSVFGLQLSDGLEQAQSLPLVTTLQNGTLLLGGRPLPLVFTSAGQINVQIPYDIPPGTIQQIIAQHGTKLSVPQPVSIRSSEPAIFSTDSSGAGQGHIYVITSSGQQLLANASNPATAGDVLVIYCTGLGNVSPAVTAGTAVPSDALRNTVGQTTLTIGGVNAAVAFAGLTPGLTGLYQVNVTVPAGVTAGNQVPVVLAVDGEPAPPVSMAVK